MCLGVINLRGNDFFFIFKLNWMALNECFISGIRGLVIFLMFEHCLKLHVTHLSLSNN